MAEYIEKNHFDERIRIAVGMAEGDFTEDFKDGVLFVLSLLKSEKPADVIEREKIDKTIEEIQQTLYVDSLIFGELCDFKDGKISADDVIEKFNRVTRKEVLEILKRNIGE